MSTSTGDALDSVEDAVVVVDGDQVVAWSPGAAQLFGVSREAALEPGARPLGDHLPGLLALPPDGSAVRRPLAPYGVVEVRHRLVGEHHMLLVRDVSVEVRRSEGLRALSRLSRGLLGDIAPSLATVLQTVASEAKAMTGSAYSAVMLLSPGGGSEPTHFVYDAPRELFPDRMPRLVGVFAVPVRTRRPARLEAGEGHQDSRGLPSPHPPIGPLCAVPLMAGAEVLGVLAVASPPGGRSFDDVDEELMVDLGGHTAVAVRWAQSAEREEVRIRQRSEVVRTARHDIRTPLGAGKGYSRLLLDKRDKMTPEQVDLALDGLRQAFERIESMTELLLVDEQLELSGIEPQWAVVDLPALLAEVVRDFAASTGRPDAVQVALTRDAPRQLAGDPGMVREVVDNLVGNALKHGGSGPVTVSARLADGTVRIDVRDEGPGIDEVDQAGLFERWTRTSASRVSGTGGFGLGLSIVKRLVDAHGGAVGVSSRRGEGATFWVSFPAQLP